MLIRINLSTSVDTMEMNIYFYELNFTQGSEIRFLNQYPEKHFKDMESFNVSMIATVETPYAAGK